MNPQIGFLLNKSLEALRNSNLELAELYLKQALRLQSSNPHVLRLLGVIFAQRRQYSDALKYLNASLKALPKNSLTLANLGNVFLELKEYSNALDAYDRSIKIDPQYEEAWSNKGKVLNELKHFDEAIAHHDKALGLKPDIEWVRGDLAHTKMKICNWSDLADSIEIISKKVIANERVSQPFLLLALHDNALLHKKSSETYTYFKYPLNTALGSITKSYKKEKIRIGYFSADFKNHAVGFLIAELFEVHDKKRFEIYGFSFKKANDDEMQNRITKAFDHFIDVENKSDIEIAKLSRDLEIDIAIDLGGFTTDARTGIFSYRAAPIQVNYLGYPGTIGANYMDYIIADKTLIPTSSQDYYSEKVVYLPHSYQANDRKRAISDKQFTRQELDLPGQGFVFCCFNNNFKILPDTFTGWMRILKAVEGSVLWLFQDNQWAKANLINEAEKQGIDARRLVFAQRMPHAEHLSRHRQANLFLDTLPYNAHTTASDSLWAGLPVLTLVGDSFASRVAASLLNAIGLPELIANTQEEYEDLAIDLATNPHRLTDIKMRLDNNRLIAPLFDTPLFAKNLEAAYIKMYERYHADLRPDHLFFA